MAFVSQDYVIFNCTHCDLGFEPLREKQLETEVINPQNWDARQIQQMQHAAVQRRQKHAQTGNREEETVGTNLLNVFVPYPSSPIPRMSYRPSRESQNRKTGRRRAATWATTKKGSREWKEGAAEVSPSGPWAASRGSQIHQDRTRAGWDWSSIIPEGKPGRTISPYGDVSHKRTALTWLLYRWPAPEAQCLWLRSNKKRTTTRQWRRETSVEDLQLWPTLTLRVHTCVSVSLLTVRITAILLTLFVLVERELSRKDEILFTFVIEWLWRERKHGGQTGYNPSRSCRQKHAKTNACRKWGVKRFPQWKLNIWFSRRVEMKFIFYSVVVVYVDCTSLMKVGGGYLGPD